VNGTYAGVAVRTTRLTKRFGSRTAVDAVDLVVPSGSIVGYLGPNGAGKTTTLKIVAGLWRPTSGAATVLGMDAVRDRDRIQRRLGYLPGDFTGYPGMTGRQLLTLLGRLRGGVDDAVITDLADRFAVDLDRRLGTLSHGNRQKVGIIQAFMHRPELLILDEPTAGLDPLMQHEFLCLVREARDAGATVLLSSHVLSEVAALADHVAVIDEGTLRVSLPIADLLDRASRHIDLTFTQTVPMHALERVDGVRTVVADVDARTARVTLSGSTAELLRAAAPYGVSDIHTREPDLADVLLGLYSHREEDSDVQHLQQGPVGAAS
jgi:ABC-2 type transport system ATP-binding protein